MAVLVLSQHHFFHLSDGAGKIWTLAICSQLHSISDEIQKKKGTALTLEERYRVQRLPRWSSVIFCASRAFRGGDCNLKIRAQCRTPQTSRVCFLLDMKKKEHKPLKRRIVFITLCLDGHVASTLHPARLSHRASKHTAKRRP